MRVYLCGPINGCTDDQAHTWRESVKAALGEANCIDPMRRDYRGREDQDGIASVIVNGDLNDIDDCDVLLANCWQPSWGTAMEIYYASRHAGLQVIAVLPPGTRVSPWLRYHAIITHSLDEALGVIQRLDVAVAA